jgi:SMODS-associated and fused to various effectors sensor domain
MTTPDEPIPSPPSLLSAQSRGGDINEGGLDFQMAVSMTCLPRWLAMEGFTMLIREASGDFEAQFFTPGHSYAREFLEAKDHLVTPKEFWEEIEHFQKFALAGDEFRWFTLVSGGLSTELHPLINGLRRLRDPYAFYGPDSAILERSYADYVAIVQKLGRSSDDAFFLFTKVKIEPHWAQAREGGRARFRDALFTEMPSFQDVSGRRVNEAYAALEFIVRASRNKPIRRDDLEKVLQGYLPAEQRVTPPPVRMHTAMDGAHAAPPQEIVFAWARFFAGEARSFPPPAEWNGELLLELRNTKEWMLNHRATRRIRLSGERRLSASVAFGSVFSAVAGFAIDMISRDAAIWSTDAHERHETPNYVLNRTAMRADAGEDLVVSIGIPRDISADVELALPALKLATSPARGRTCQVRPAHPRFGGGRYLWIKTRLSNTREDA